MLAMYITISALPQADRERIASALNSALVDALALHIACKTAHWNVKGPGANALHRLFDDLAKTARQRGDALAERITSLGALAQATAPAIASASPLASYPVSAVKCEDHLRALHGHYSACAARLRNVRAVSAAASDHATVQLLDAHLHDVEHEAGFLSAHLDA